jgi:hypothetical protein
MVPNRNTTKMLPRRGIRSGKERKRKEENNHYTSM